MNILVVCAAGMSSSSLVFKLRETIKEAGYTDLKVGSCASNQVEEYIQETDLVLLTPQLVYLEEEIRKNYPNKEIRMIRSKAYGQQDTHEILKLILGESLPEESKSFYHSKTGKRILKSSQLLGSNKIIRSINSGFMSVFNVTIIGSFMLLILKLPMPSFQSFMVEYHIADFLQLGIDMTMNLISIYAVFFIGYHYGKQLGIPPWMAGLNALVNFFILIGRDERNLISIEYLGNQGLFTALFTAVLATWIFNKATVFNKKILGWLKSIQSERIVQSFIAIIPIFVSVCVFMIFAGIFKTSEYQSFPAWLSISIGQFLIRYIGTNIYSEMFLSAVAHLLWFFGIHGGTIVGSLTKPLYSSMAMMNMQAYNAGLDLPFIIHSQFKYMYVFGGAGSTLCLVILMMFMSKSKNMKSLGRISFPLGLFFINETVIFGLPVVLNPVVLIPFVFISPLLSFMTYYAMLWGWIPYANGIELPWTTPPIISGFLQGGIKLALWQIAMLALGTLLWYPFFKVMDNRYLKEEVIPEPSKSLPQ